MTREQPSASSLDRMVCRRAPPAVLLYRGEVFHARLRPVPHRFRYRVFSILIDLVRLAEAGCTARLFSVNRGNLLAFHERDHGPRDGTPLRDYVRRLLKAHGLPCEGG